MASSADQGFFAAGPNPVIIGAAAGYAIGAIAKTEQVYSNCMQATGYLPGEAAAASFHLPPGIDAARRSLSPGEIEVIASRCGDTINNCAYR